MTAAEHAHDDERPPRPAFTQPRLLLLVLLGGALGAGAREAVTLAFPSAGGIPWAILAVNLSGAFLLGFLLVVLASRAPETPARRDLRLFAGTGILGGFTTYSALASDTVALLATDPALAVAYAIGSVVAGLLAAWGGIRIATLALPASGGRP